MSFIPPVLPRAVRVLRTSSNPTTNFRCFHAPTLPRSLPVPRNSNHSPRRSFHSTPRSQASVKNPYSVLGLDKNASTSAIKKAYYSLAKKWHPDQNKDSSAREKFQEIQSAYEILTDPAKKEQFDQYGESAFKPSAGFNPDTGAGFGQSGFHADFSTGFSFEDLFSAFGGTSRQRTSGSEGGIPFGENIEVETTISFMEAAKGASKDIHIHAFLPCKTCAGTGMRSGTQRQPCGRCGGTGTRVHFMQGGFQMASTCDACKGAGVVIPRGSECDTCDGWGVTKEPRTIKIDIPAGVDTGMRIKVENEGDAPHSNPSGAPSTKARRGDLFVHLRVTPHKHFRRKGLDVYYTATIPPTTALLGGRIRVPTLSGGEEDIEVPLGTTTGDTAEACGKGIRGINSLRVGNFTVEFKVNPPKTLTAHQRILLEMLAEELNDKTARRIMGVSSKEGPSPYKQHKNENFIKRAWHNLTHQHDDMPKGDDDQKKASGSG
ncbi:hypothetical protein HOY82DRAFT_557755 [Tuber indicum]|nr:hypothetical protein HOY82DRAFT_557755 [Tuber indicum]